MSKHSKIGIKGEQFAEYFLQKKGYTILQRNWRAGKKEVDIIAFKDDVVAIIEVKTRSRAFLAFPEEAVNIKKKNHLRDAAEVFMCEFPAYKNIRFDIISVLLDGDNVKEIIHFEEAFY